MASLAYLAFYLCLHACAARPLMFFDKETILQTPDKDMKTLNRGTSFMQMDGQGISPTRDGEEGKQDKVITYTDKSLPRAAGTEEQERVERLALESKSHKAEENVSSGDTNGPVEDVVVMDYAHPHRKPPIHNRGT